ncbi:MAG: TIM barrel protein [Sphaerochaetaceae bacterium]|nr:TIM barrel protein [Sphaerochaetaceae bacterium]
MKNSIHDFCRVGIVHGMAYPESSHDPETYISTLKKILVDTYFDVVEIGAIPWKELHDRVPAMIKAAHMQFTYCGHSRLFGAKLNINSLDESERKAAVATLKEGIDEAYDWGAEDFQFLSRGWTEPTREACLSSLIRSSVELCKYAASKGTLPVCLEVFDYDIDKKSLVGPGWLAKQYVEAVCSECDNFGLMLDCSHIPMIHETIDEAVDPVCGHIVHAHIGNTLIADSSNPVYGDNHPRFGYPGSENDTDYLAAFLRKLLDVGYLSETRRPILSFEVKPQLGEYPDIVVANAKRTLEAAWRLV